MVENQEKVEEVVKVVVKRKVEERNVGHEKDVDREEDKLTY